MYLISWYYSEYLYFFPQQIEAMATEELCSSLVDKGVHASSENESNKENVISGSFEPAEHDGDHTEPVIDIIINNVVCTFSTRCHLNLKQIAMIGANVEYRREQGVS